MEFDLVGVEWEYEDQLPELNDLQYDLIYQKSELIGGVRKFPFVKIYDDKGNPIRYYLSV